MRPEAARRPQRAASRLSCVALALAGILLSACGSLAPSSPMVYSDPVCGAVVNRSKAIRKVYGGKDYYFDSEECAAEFELHPSTYAAIHTSRVGPR